MTMTGPVSILHDGTSPIQSRQVHDRNVISVSSGKGGVGKTWFSISLCQALANMKRKILLFDGDLGLANVDVQLGLMPRYDLSSVLSGRRSLENTVTTVEQAGFDLIAGQSGAGSLAALPPQRLAGLRKAVFRMAHGYDQVVMDIGAGVDRTVQTLVQGVAENIVITTDEPTALTDAYAFIKVMSTVGAGDRIRIVINMASDHRHGEHTYQTLLRACENFLKISPPLAGIVRRDTHVSEAIRHQAALFTRHPNCDAAIDVATIAERIGSMP